jgi:hypothetical protein
MGSSLDSVETVGFPFVDFDLSPLVQAGRFDFNQISFLFGLSSLISLGYERESDGSTRLSRSQHRTSEGAYDF